MNGFKWIYEIKFSIINLVFPSGSCVEIIVTQSTEERIRRNNNGCRPVGVFIFESI